jgi:hypothetical protein
VGLPSGFLGGGSGFEVAASCGVATSTERPVALRVLRIGALVRADGGASADACRAWVGVSARADPEGQTSTLLLASSSRRSGSDAGLGVGGE